MLIGCTEVDSSFYPYLSVDQSGCKIFNFSLTSINSSEYIIKAELRLHMDITDESLRHIHVRLQPLKSRYVWSSSMDLNVEKGNHHQYMFDVAALISSMASEGVYYMHFM